jgi:hypothetical protein
MRFVALGAVALLLAGLAVVGIGALLPVRHRAMREQTVRASPPTVFKLITDVAQYPTWRSGVQRVDGQLDRVHES